MLDAICTGNNFIDCQYTKLQNISIVIAQASKYDLVDEALKISKCESNFDNLAQNKNSSAKGLFQITNRTWDKYCKGKKADPIDNTKCFLKLYRQHKNWWVCKA